MRFLACSLLLSTVFAKQTLNVLVINDFSLAFVPNTIDQSLRASGPYICPPSAYPNALAEFQFTSDVIDGIKKGTPMKIQYYAYSGGDGDPIGNTFSNRDNFTEASIPAYTKFCSEGPEENDFERYIKLTITPAINTDVLILFTAATQAQVDKALPILSDNVKKVIVLALNGSKPSYAYSNSSVILPNFAEPARVSCMIDELYETIYGKVNGDPVGVCYPPEVQTTAPMETTTERENQMRILFINDFTSDYIEESSSMKQAPKPARAMKCPGGAHPEASDEFNFTEQVINGIAIPMVLYYYANNGELRPIPDPVSKDNFETDTEFKNVVCLEDDPQPSDFPSLMEAIYQHGATFDIIVLFSAASQSQFDDAFPQDFNGATLISVGLKGASASHAYPNTSIVINDFSQPEMLTCMIEAAYNREENPVKLCQPKGAVSVLFVNDFTTDFVGDDAALKQGPPANAASSKCPEGAYPQAGAEVDFSVNIVSGLSETAYVYSFAEYPGGDAFYFDGYLFRDIDDFIAHSHAAFSETCSDAHYPTDFEALTRSLTSLGLPFDYDVLVLFTAVSLDRPLNLPNFKRVLVVGLNGAIVSKAYPDSSISITDFSRPQIVSCMLKRLSVNLKASLASCAN